MKSWSLKACLLLGCTIAAGANAGLIVNGSGILTGATGVNVGGTLYDVTFQDGTCAALFAGCDSTSDFAFQTGIEARDASEALLAQVFIDAPDGHFDSVPNLTFGCGFTQYPACAVMTPYGVVQGQFVSFRADNYAAGAGSDSTPLVAPLSPTDDTSGDNRLFAVWTPVTTVPEPSTLSLLGAGLIGLFFLRPRRATA